ncbi:MAG: hypothetical protein L0H59_17160 [Tomitella sp.]|nr:hypothetical protein [Tomitella sp.]
MTASRAVEIYIEHMRRSSRGVITGVVLGGYLAGVLAAAGALVLAGVKIGRRTA